MHRSVLRVGAAFAAGVVSVSASAQSVRVEIWTTDRAAAYSGSFASGTPITGLPPIPADIARINIYSVGGQANIGPINLNAGNAPGQVDQGGGPLPEFDLFLGAGPVPTGGGLAAAGINFGGITAPAAVQPRIRLIGAVSGNVTGPIDVGRVTSLAVGGAITSDVIASAEGDAIGAITAGRIGAVAPGKGAGTRTVGAGFSIIAPNGRINSLSAVSEIDVPGTISAKRGIASITARAVRANIIADAFDGDGNFEYIRCENGDFTGSLTANNLGNPGGKMPGTMISIAGVMRASLTLHGNLYGGVSVEGFDPVSRESMREIKVEGDMLGVIDAQGSIGTVRLLRNIRLDPTSFVLPAIRSRAGSISLLDVGGFVEGDTGLFPSIQAVAINTLRVGGDLHAMVTAWPSGFVGVKHTDIGGNFKGSFYLSSLDDFSIRGDLLEASQVWKHGRLLAGRSISIGNSLRGLIVIDEPLGLLGQITINANLDPMGVWAPSGLVGLVQPDGTSRFLTRASYAAQRDSVGGGGIGVAPFSLRDQECSPRPHTVVPTIPSLRWPDGVYRETMILTLDGPVGASAPDPLIIEKAHIPASCAPGELCPPNFADFSADYDVLAGPPGRSRQVWIAPKPDRQGIPGTFDGGWLYRINARRIDGHSLLHSLGTNIAVPVDIGSLSFQVAVDAFDLNHDGATDPRDAMTWNENPVDFNDDGTPGLDDFETLLDAIELHRP